MILDQVHTGSSAYKLRKYLLSTASVGILAAIPIHTAMAQDSVQPNQGGLADIVVTARKRTETSQNVPVAVTAISTAQLERYSMTSLERVAASTPQLVIGRSGHGSGASFTIRGIGAPPLSTGVEQDVAVVVDGTYYGQGRIINDGFFDLAGIEILKGPQALFFGKNATAGVISIKSADPSDNTEAMVRAGYEFRAQETYGEAYYSTPLTDTFGIRVAVRASKMFGHMLKNLSDPEPYTTFDLATGLPTTHPRTAASPDQPGDRQLSGRITMKWTPTDNFDATVKIFGTAFKNNGPNGMTVPVCASGLATYQLEPNRACLGNRFVTSQGNAPAALGATRHFRGGELYTDYKSWGVNAALNYSFDNATITSISNYNKNTAYVLVDDGGTNADTNLSIGANYFGFHAFSNETRVMTSFDGPLNVVLGGYYQNTDFEFNEVPHYFKIDNSAAPADIRYAMFDHVSSQKGETLSGYGQLIWKVVPAVEVTGGVRYSHETKDSLNSQPYVNPALAGLFLAVTQTQDQTFSNWSPDVTVAWKPAPDINVYGSYKTAFKSGGYALSANLVVGSSPDQLSFDQETVKGFEGGIKTILFDRQLRFNVAAYTYGYDNLQLQYFNPVRLSFSVLTSDARSKGIELDTEFAPRSIEGLTLNGSLNYNKTTYTRFVAPCFAGQSQAEGCTILTDPTDPRQDMRGKTLPSAPRWTASLGANYETAVSDGLLVALSTQARYSSRYNVSPLLSVNANQPRYVNLDSTLALKSADSRWELALIGKNLTNQFVKTSTNEIPGTGFGTGTTNARAGDAVVGINAPRTVQLQFTWKM